MRQHVEEVTNNTSESHDYIATAMEKRVELH